MDKNANITYHELTCSQQTVYYQFRFSLYKQVCQIPVFVSVNKQLDFDLMEQAVNIEISRNDSMRLFFKKVKDESNGKRYVQYFTPPYKTEPISVVDFTGKSAEEQKAFLDKVSCRPLRFNKDEIFKFIFVKTYDGRSGIYLVMCHLNADATAVFLIFKELFEIYYSLIGQGEMPKPLDSFEECVIRENTLNCSPEKYSRDAEYFKELYGRNGEPIYNGVQGIEYLESIRKKKKNPNKRTAPIYSLFSDRTKKVAFDVGSEMTDLLNTYCINNGVSHQAVINLAICSYLSSINNKEKDILYTTIFNRRATIQDKNTGGNIVDGVPIRLLLRSELSWSDSVLDLSGELFKATRHLNFPTVSRTKIAQKMYDRNPLDGWESFMFTFFPHQFPIPDGWDFDIEWISVGHFAMPVYVLVFTNPQTGNYEFAVEYRYKVISQKNIEDLFEGTMKALRAGISDPNQSLGSIIDELSNK